MFYRYHINAAPVFQYRPSSATSSRGVVIVCFPVITTALLPFTSHRRYSSTGKASPWCHVPHVLALVTPPTSPWPRLATSVGGRTPLAHALFTRASGKTTGRSEPSTADARSAGAGESSAPPDASRLRRNTSRAQSVNRVTCTGGGGRGGTARAVSVGVSARERSPS